MSRSQLRCDYIQDAICPSPDCHDFLRDLPPPGPRATTLPHPKPEPPPAPLPLAFGSLSAVQGCLDFRSYMEVPPTTDRFHAGDGINSCRLVTNVYDVDYHEFLSWNPSLQGMGLYCYLQPGYRYCARHRDATGKTGRNSYVLGMDFGLLLTWYTHSDLGYEDEDEECPVDGKCCVNITEPHPGTVSSCSCFTIIHGWAVGLHLCEDIAADQHITVSDLVKWNTWVRAEWRCDSDLYDGMADSDERPVCVGVEDSGSTTGGSMSLRQDQHSDVGTDRFHA
ncbi:hypothetical protein PG984_005092 [Apiospora sp. TS-2023a]